MPHQGQRGDLRFVRLGLRFVTGTAWRNYALGGTRTPLTGAPGGVASHGTVVRYWMALTEADIRTESATAVPLHYDGTKFRPEVPPSITASSHAAYIGDLPRPGTVTNGRVYSIDDSANHIDVWLRAEAEA
jgi:hypothetical protein